VLYNILNCKQNCNISKIGGVLCRDTGIGDVNEGFFLKFNFFWMTFCGEGDTVCFKTWQDVSEIINVNRGLTFSKDMKIAKLFNDENDILANFLVLVRSQFEITKIFDYWGF
jgi:hypothetical protein